MRNARLRHSQSESWRRIGEYVAKPAFFTRTSGLLFLSLSLTPGPDLACNAYAVLPGLIPNIEIVIFAREVAPGQA